MSGNHADTGVKIMKALTVALAVLVLLSGNAEAEGEQQCGRVRWSAHNGIMTYQGRYAVVTLNPINDSFACWQIYNTLQEAVAANRKRVDQLNKR
jgi:hypothetical protein